MALRSMGIPLKDLSNKNFCNFRPAFCLAPAAATCHNITARHLMPVHQLQNKQINFCEHFHKNINKPYFQNCTLIAEEATVRYQEQNEETSLASNRLIALSENKYPDLDVSPPIRKVAPMYKEMTNVSYISSEFKELLRKHDERMKQKYILNFLPDKYTSQINSNKKLKEKSNEIKPYCICEEIKATTATAGDKTNASKKRNFLKCLSCFTGEKESAEEFKECRCEEGKRGECEMCSRSLKKPPALKKYDKKSKEKDFKVSKAKSVEILKDKRDLQNRYWVGTESEVQKYDPRRTKQQQQTHLEKTAGKPKLKERIKTCFN